jgi:hypothetical protein
LAVRVHAGRRASCPVALTHRPPTRRPTEENLAGEIFRPRSTGVAGLGDAAVMTAAV